MEFLQARETFFIGPRKVPQGTLVRSDDPIVAGRERLFLRVSDVVENASARPGTKRSTQRARPVDETPSEVGAA